MIRKLQLFTALLAGLLLVLPLQAETQRVDGLEFKRVEIFGDSDVEIRQGNANELRLRGDSDDLAMQPFFIQGETLVLGRSKTHAGENFGDVKFKLTLVDLRYLGLKGSAEVYLKPLEFEELHLVVEGSGEIKAHRLEADEITLVLSGSGDIQVVKLQSEELRLILSGSGDIHLERLEVVDVEVALKGSGDVSLQKSGTANSIEVNIAGSGSADFSQLSVSTAEVNIVGSGTGRIGELESLEVNIMGSGDVFYRGEPNIERSVLGSGELHQVH